ncbi:hypothetical protein BHE74_00008851 [Ensete ventricosum]|nr:hypothetical protein BHE74_00008851 [Ensete ventricosum]
MRAKEQSRGSLRRLRQAGDLQPSRSVKGPRRPHTPGPGRCNRIHVSRYQKGPTADWSWVAGARRAGPAGACTRRAQTHLVMGPPDDAGRRSRPSVSAAFSLPT